VAFPCSRKVFYACRRRHGSWIVQFPCQILPPLPGYGATSAGLGGNGFRADDRGIFCRVILNSPKISLESRIVRDEVVLQHTRW
jgi:hypothetical protein